MLILDVLRSCLLAGVVLGLVPVEWWSFKGRKQAKFTLYFGLIRPKKTRQAAFMIGIYGLIWGITHLPYLTQYTQPSASLYAGMGSTAIFPILIISFVQTGFLEEFLFRGFLNKRPVCRFGVYRGVLL